MNWTGIKRKAIITGVSLAALGVTFAVGTFNPNAITVNGYQKQIETNFLKEAVALGMHEPDFVYTDPQSFMDAVGNCVDYINFTTPREQRVPSAIIIAMAGIESGWGTSRFTKEGNNLFGIRTWDADVPQMKPLDLPNAEFGVKTYPTKCASVQHAINILNEHYAYEGFRVERTRQIAAGIVDYKLLSENISPWSVNEKYSNMIVNTIASKELP
jgi:hypothetical protein|tara:strand:- start:34 stop:675 length:642 start_codon:yes stop_codon:yes gene_type:complete